MIVKKTLYKFKVDRQWFTYICLCVDHNKLWKFWKRWEYQTTWPASWETCTQVGKQQLELDMEQQFQIGSK